MVKNNYDIGLFFFEVASNLLAGSALDSAVQPIITWVAVPGTVIVFFVRCELLSATP
jgi:hypothetical protein